MRFYAYQFSTLTRMELFSSPHQHFLYILSAYPSICHSPGPVPGAFSLSPSNSPAVKPVLSPPFKEIFQPSVLLSCSFSHRPGRSAWSRADAQYTLNNDRILLFFLIPNSSRAHTYSLHLLPSFLSRFCSLPLPVSPDLLSRRSETADDLPHLRACNFVLSLLSRLQGSAPSPSPSTLISYLEIRILFFFSFESRLSISFLFICLLNGANAFPRFSSRLCSL